MVNGVSDAQLDAARGVFDVWAGILQRKVAEERLSPTPDAEKIKDYQEAIYAVTRHSRELGAMDLPTFNAAVDKYAALISEFRGSKAEVL